MCDGYSTQSCLRVCNTGAVSLFSVFVVGFVVFFHCFSVYVYRLHFKFQRLDAALLRNMTLRIHLLTFISGFVIDSFSV